MSISGVTATSDDFINDLLGRFGVKRAVPASSGAPGGSASPGGFPEGGSPLASRCGVAAAGRTSAAKPGLPKQHDHLSFRRGLQRLLSVLWPVNEERVGRCGYLRG